MKLRAALTLSALLLGASGAQAATPRKVAAKAVVPGSVNGAVREVYRDWDGNSQFWFYGWVDDTDSLAESEMTFHLNVVNAPGTPFFSHDWAFGPKLGCLYCTSKGSNWTFSLEGYSVRAPFWDVAAWPDPTYRWANMSIGANIWLPAKGYYDVTLAADNIAGTSGSGKTLGTFRLKYGAF